MKALLSPSMAIFLGVLTCLGEPLRGDETTDYIGHLKYIEHVKPLLTKHCYACHGALKQESDLRLDTRELILQGGSSGPALIAGDAEQSELLTRLMADDDTRMPPDGSPLPAADIEQLRRWIERGAEGPRDESPEKDPGEHWAFQKLTRPALPAPDNGNSSALTHPIDAFVAAKRGEQSIQPLPLADKATLLRRLYLDLIGLPPSLEELQAFLDDDSADAFEQVVDRLLAAPQHGERWGRHWMDVWRYSDWYGRRSVPDVMNSYPMIWRWRDWIVRSLNEDKPYDRMVTEMLAGDELLPTDELNVVATGFLVRSWFKWNYETWKKDLVEHTGKAFLGVTLNCCQCHDHKYDPFSQEDYFRFRAFFEPLELRHDRVPGEADPGKFRKYVYVESYGPINSGLVRVFDEYLDAPTRMFANGDARLIIDGQPPVQPGVPTFLQTQPLPIAPLELPLAAAYPGIRDFIKDEELSKLRAQVQTTSEELKALHPTAGHTLPLQAELQAAELALETAREQAYQRLAASDTQPHENILEGRQSLVIDAKLGRRLLSHALPGLDTLRDGAHVSYLIQIVQDGHTNLQLALDTSQGLTGGYVAFEAGSIKTYAPGGFNEFSAGTYDLAAGQNRFEVRLQLDLAHDRFLLSVTSLADQSLLVDSVPAALNGWKPQADGKRGLFIDCRPGTAANFDALAFMQPDGAPLLRFDFETPPEEDGLEIVQTTADAGTMRWIATNFCQPPATSKVISAVSSDADLQAALARTFAARQASRLPDLKLRAATAKWDAAEQELASLELRIATDLARYEEHSPSSSTESIDEHIQAQIEHACLVERRATVATAQANALATEVGVAVAEIQLAESRKQSDAAAIESTQQALLASQQLHSAASERLREAQVKLTEELGEYTPLSPKYPEQTSGRRTALAQWITSPDNPLTARVAVNHIWIRHFGQAIVDTTDDFGRNGSPPTHPELIDWLASELVDSGWSMKHLHRLIVTSQTYRLASMLPADHPKLKTASASHELDPDNRYLWHFPVGRMQAEVVRDSLLAVAGTLENTMGGHELDHQQGLTSHRRSLYFAHHGEEKMEFLELFDGANPSDCYKRTLSVQPQQALALTNSELTQALSRTLALQLWSTAQEPPAHSRVLQAVEQDTASDAQSDAESLAHELNQPLVRFARLAFLHVLNREPLDAELQATLRFLKEQSVLLEQSQTLGDAKFDPQERARANVIHALMNHNDFVTIR